MNGSRRAGNRNHDRQTPMDADELAIFRHHTGRQRAPQKPCKEACLVVGRRGGKSRLLAILGVFLATIPDYRRYTAPGETPIVAIIAADRKQAKVIFGYISGLLHAVPRLAALIEDELAETIRLKNGTAIEIHTSSISSPRGRTYIAVLGDEIAFWQTDLSNANPDREVVNAVRPGLATLPSSMLLVASSPYARRGYLFDTYARYWGRDDAPVLVWRGTTLEMNSALDPRIVEEAYEADPESASAEYGAEFRSDITAFIGRDAVQAVVADGVIELPPAAGISYTGWTDPSGGSTDPMTLAVAHMDAEGIAVLDATREVKPPFSPESVVEEFAALLRSYRISRVYGDAYAGEWPRERFAIHGISYEVSSRNKNAIYGDFLPALNGRRIRLLDQPRLIGQLCGLERRTSRGGKDSIDHSPGGHDDVANAVAGALTLCINDRRPALIREKDLLGENEQALVPRNVGGIVAMLYADSAGMCAWVLGGAVLTEPPAMYLLDHWAGPWSFGVLDQLAVRMDEEAEVALAASRNAGTKDVSPQMRWLMEVQGTPGFIGIGAAMLVPPQLQGAANLALSRAFSKHSGRFDWYRRRIGADAIEDWWFSDLTGTLLTATTMVGQNRVKLGPRAREKMGSIPLAGALEIKDGEPIDADPLRVALMVLCAQLGPVSGNSSVGSARLVLG
jgi:hypothetical protein